MTDPIRSYLRHGFHLFPIEPGTKQPLSSLAPNGHLSASNDPAIVESWLEKRPDAWFGIALGPSSLVALDVDVGPEKLGEESINEFPEALQASWVQKTPSGGYHFVFKQTDNSQTRRIIRFRPGLDLLGDGYIVAAPSGDYQWVKQDGAPDTPCPDVLADIFRQKRTASSQTPTEQRHDYGAADPQMLADIAAELHKRGPSIKGQGGDQHCYSIAALLIYSYGLQWEEALDLMRGWNAAFPENSWSDAKLQQKLKNGWLYGQGEYGDKRREWQIARLILSQGKPEAAPKVADSSWQEKLEKAASDLLAYRGDSESGASKFENPIFSCASDLFSDEYEFPAQTWIVDRLITAESLGVTSAEPKSCKTWAELEIDVAIATGTPAFGVYATGPRRHVALFLAEDQDRSLRNRLRALFAGRGVDPADGARFLHFACRKHLDLTRDEDLVWIIASCRSLPQTPALIEIDPLRDVHSGDEDKSGDMGEIMGNLRAIRDIVGCCVRFVHHSRKSNGDGKNVRSGQKMRGSGAVHGAIDCGFYMETLDTDERSYWESKVHVEIKAAAGAGVFSMRLEVTDDDNREAVRAAWKVGVDDPGLTQTEAKRSVEAELVRVIGEYGRVANWTRLEQECVSRGHGRNAVRSARLRLEAAGRIEEAKEYRETGGAPRKIFRVVSSNDDPDPEPVTPKTFVAGLDWSKRE